MSVNLAFDPARSIMTPEEYSKHTGIPVATIISKLNTGELPRYDQRYDKTKRGALYVNVLKIALLAAEQPFDHPSLTVVGSR